MPSPKTALIAIDDASVREQLKPLLNQEGYQVILTANTLKTLTSLHDTSPNLIVFDLMMLTLNAWQFLLQSRAKREPHIAIIAATSTDMRPEEAQAHGYSGCIRKPLVPDKVLKEIRRCVSKDRWD